MSNSIKLIIFLFAISLLIMAIFKYLSFHSAIADLGFFQTHLNNIANLHEYWRAFFGHAQPYLLLYSWWYSIFPTFVSPILLLVLQSALLILPIFWLRKHYGLIVVFAYLLYFPLWFNALFDFHMDHLVIPLLIGFFLVVEAKKIFLAAIIAIALALVKEPFALQTAACGLYLILFGNSRRYLSTVLGIGLIVFGFAYFYFVTHYIFPFVISGYHGGLNSGAFSWLGSGISEMVINIVTNPVPILQDIVSTPGKMIYLVAVFGALGFISLLYPKPLIVALPILAISLLSHLDNYYGIGHHYTAGLVGPMIYAFAKALPRAQSLWQTMGFSLKSFTLLLIIGLIAGNIVLSPSPISRLFWSDKIWSYHYSAYIPTERDQIIKAAIEKYIPKNQNVIVSSQNTLNWSWLAHRHYYFIFPMGVVEPVEIADMSQKTLANFIKYLQTGDLPEQKNENKWADYVLLDLKRPWFIKDKGCDWYYGECHNMEKANKFMELVNQTQELYKIIYEWNGFLILRRNSLETKS